MREAAAFKANSIHPVAHPHSFAKITILQIEKVLKCLLCSLPKPFGVQKVFEFFMHFT